MINRKILIISALLFSVFCLKAFCQSTTPEPYNEEEFPQALKDLRRFEIITLGSLPFVTMDVGLVKSSIDKAKGVEGAKISPFPSIEGKEPEEFFKDPQIWASLGISVAIGVTDYIVQVSKRNKLKKITNNQNAINIISISEDPEAIKIQKLNEQDENSFEEVEIVQEEPELTLELSEENQSPETTDDSL